MSEIVTPREDKTEVAGHQDFARSSEAWENHFDELAKDGSFTMFDLEARDFVGRLQISLPLRPGMRVLDFGCGFGAVSERLAAMEVELRYWDRSDQMRRFVELRLKDYANAGVLDLSASDERFDLIVVNSVIQYMSPDDLKQWLAEWGRLLARDGRIVVSDIIPPSSNFSSEVLDSLRFAAANGFLIASIGRLAQEFLRYTKRRRSLTLLRLDRAQFLDLAAAIGLSTEFLKANLTFRRKRLSAILTLEG